MPEQDTTTDAAAESTGDSTEATETTTESATDTGEAVLGDAGKQALDRMKAERKAARDEAAAAKAERDALQAKLDGKEAEFTAAQEAQRIKDEAIQAANERILKAELRAAAKGKLTDPTDVFRFPEIVGDLSAFEVGADGEVDPAALDAAVNNLISKRPDLAAQGSRFQGSADGGARNGATQPTQLTRADLARMSPEQINDARKEGLLNDLLGGSK